ncbi:uncharacterized protein LOC123267384 [Cotesia glomerata]|uniref:Uncharacterized protein n=1 Tax=Cotesia glomerata TaxID=32391 RepID=A0AAV7HT69_COTGL|nr:uncharacterized protein LOC123267384 [Cotesia glomerata]KAH0534323.1 hypothetical protein KQX54_003077 [Cotesia glomerata]
MALKLSLLAAILSIGFVSGQDPTAQFKFNVVTVKNVAGNPYFDDWSAVIHSPETISVKSPVKKELPDNMMMKVAVDFAGSDVAGLDILLCEAFEDETYGKNLLSYGIPKGVFPTFCPVKPGSNFELSKVKIGNDQIPPGFPDGDIIADITMYEPGKDPYVTIHVEATLSHSVPGVPGLGR